MITSVEPDEAEPMGEQQMKPRPEQGTATLLNMAAAMIVRLIRLRAPPVTGRPTS
jgi:hypothetical protein